MQRQLTQQVAPPDEDERTYLESLIRTDYEQCHPGDTLEDLKHRARFSTADKGLLRDWMEVARRRAAANNTAPVMPASFLAAE
jgi:hypothetical protein